jgi:hypothetical protein
MNIAFTINELNELNVQPRTSASAKRGWGLAHWILFAGILCGLASLALATVANAHG